MRRPTRTAIAALTVAAALTLLTACGGRSPDGGNPGNPSADTTTTTVVGG